MKEGMKLTTQDFRERIELYRHVYKEKETGEFVRSWKPVSKVWAQVIPMGSDAMSSSQGWGKSGDKILSAFYKIRVRSLEVRGIKFDQVRWKEKKLRLSSIPCQSICGLFEEFMVMEIINRKED